MIFVAVQTKYALNFFLINLGDGQFIHCQTSLLAPRASFFESFFQDIKKKWQVESHCPQENFYLICDKKDFSLQGFFKEKNVFNIEEMCLDSRLFFLGFFEDFFFDGKKICRPKIDFKLMELFSFEQNGALEMENYFANKELFGGILPPDLRDADKEQALLSFYAFLMKIKEKNFELRDLIIAGPQINLSPLFLEQKIEALLWGINRGLFRVLLDDKMLVLVAAFLKKIFLREADIFLEQLKFLPACYILALPEGSFLSFDFIFKKKNEMKLKKDEVFLIPFKSKGAIRIFSRGKKMQFSQEKSSLGLVVDTREKDIGCIQGLLNKEAMKTQWHKTFSREGKF